MMKKNDMKWIRNDRGWYIRDRKLDEAEKWTEEEARKLESCRGVHL